MDDELTTSPAEVDRSASPAVPEGRGWKTAVLVGLSAMAYLIPAYYAPSPSAARRR